MTGRRRIRLRLTMTGGLVPFILLIVLQPIGTAAVLHIISQEFIDQRVSIGTAFRFALSRFGILLWTSILMRLVVGLGSLLVIPGILFLVWYAFYAQIVTVENLSGMNALNRSKTLTMGFRWRVFGILVLTMVIGLIAYVPVLILEEVLPRYDLVVVDPRNQFDSGTRFVAIYPNLWISVLVEQLLSILAEAYGAICITLLYFDLRNRKEGFDLEMAARAQLTAEQP